MILPLKIFFILAAATGLCSGVVHEDCPPTASPAPTESPAPSPSPSEAPTDTQAPTRTMSPSQSPSEKPSPSPPSSSPTTTPTESPAPSPSPSETPTTAPSFLPSMTPSDRPSHSPSQDPTLHPTITRQPSFQPSPHPSDAPSNGPTQGPTGFPSQNPTAEPSIHPTNYPTITPQPTDPPTLSPTNQPSVSLAPSKGPVGFAATGVSITLYDTKGLIGEKGVADFETLLLNFLQVNIQDMEIPDVVSITFEHVEVTNQSTVSARRRMNTIRSMEEVSSLIITFSVFALVLLEEEGMFDLKTLLEIFFSDGAKLLELREILDLTISVSEHTTPGPPAGNGDSGRAPVSGNRGQSQSDGNTVSLLGAIAGILLSAAGGSSAVYVWIRGRGHDDHPMPKLDPTSDSLSDEHDVHKSFSDSSVHIYEDDSEPSTPRILIQRGSTNHEETSEIRPLSRPSTGDSVSINLTAQKQPISRLQLLVQEETVYEKGSAYGIGSSETSESGALSYYRPALMSMESNIEIPETPKTDYDQSQYSLRGDPSKEPEADKDAPTPVMKNRRKIASSVSSVASFFSPGLLKGKKKKGDTQRGTENRKQDDCAMIRNNMSTSSVSFRSPRMSPARSPLRKRIQKHEVCTEDDTINSGHPTCRSNSPMNSAAGTSKPAPIQVLNEVAYLYSAGSHDHFSTRSRPDPDPIIRDPSAFSRRSIERMHSVSGVHGTRVDYSGLVTSLAKTNRGNRLNSISDTG